MFDSATITSSLSSQPTGSSSTLQTRSSTSTQSDLAPQLTPNSSQQTNPSTTDSASTATSTSSGDNSDGSLVNYYFVFLAILICILLVAGWIIYRRRKREAFRRRYHQQDALARDLDGWTGPRPTGRRRWGYGNWRTGPDEGSDREEGLNEAGEAPPPYKPRTSSEQGDRESAAADGEPSIPLRTVAREDTTLKPPDYSEAVVGAVEEPGRSSTMITAQQRSMMGRPQ